MSRSSGKNGRFRRRRPRRRRRLETIATAIALFAGWALQGVVRTALPGEEFSGRVSRVVDGDTFHVTGERSPVRLWGVDAPERAAPGGGKATAALARFAGARDVRCKIVDIDRYARIVARCFLDSGEDIADLMIGSGAAHEHLRYTGGFYLWRRLIPPERQQREPNAP